ncbi:uncharacterized protein EI97DRAFT_465743 [Westerdykella ornata]|uniref:Centromere protein Cenp-K n=1 Tax=Westerdykella ornata TaxID=318751 RepID=A0A6A6JPZ2_WESOR|nr:uncharacterized protein EI97DRAFT_465743 [Westerdykella ornata]KAF2278447.1 hypothetical protein EI97DRAFT_465743 [Westerdykella ornata]
MAESQSQSLTTLAHIRNHAIKSRQLYESQMDLDASRTSARLEATIKELQDQIEQQQAALENLRAKFNGTNSSASLAFASSDPRQRLKQLRTLKRAYTSLKPTATFLPEKDSVLPTLLTTRSLQQNVQGTKDAISATESQLSTTSSLLRTEEQNLHDANLITTTITSRIAKLQIDHEEQSEKSPTQLANDLIAAKRAQKATYDEKIRLLGDDLQLFITEILSPMLAAEALGGPVVGDMLDVQDETLAAGFTKKGRAKSTSKAPSERSRQLKIDQIWGNNAAVDDAHITEAEAADQEMRSLIESLFATLVGPGGGKAYFEVERETAAVRFLVRAGVAKLHPREARKVRLVDFGAELDD